MRGIDELLRIAYFRLAASRKHKQYHFQPQSVPITGTERHCHIHPANIATHFELNTQDKSYRRPVCAGCIS